MSESKHKLQFTPEGDNCLIIRFGDTISIELNQLCIQAGRIIREAKLPYISDIIPTFCTVGIFYHAVELGPNAYEKIKDQLHQLLLNIEPQSGLAQSAKTVEIPVCYDEPYGPDLAYISQRSGLSVNDIIKQHQAQALQVFMLGFAPGFPFLGVLNETFNIPRKDTPRTDVPAGSVAIANKQCVIYPNLTPGGWHIIGRTPTKLFNPEENPSVLYQPGDFVQFKAISHDEFVELSKK